MMIDKSEYEVFLIGRYFTDLVFSELPEFPRLGHEVYSKEFHLVPGGVYTPAVALHRLGVMTAWPCTFGTDAFSQYVKKQAINEGVNATFFSQGNSPSLQISAAFSFKEDRAFLSYTDPLPKYEYAELIKKIRPKWLYITHLVLRDELTKLVSAARSVGTRIYMDCQAHDHMLKETIIQDALKKVDIFSPNAKEAQQLTGKKGIDSILDDLSEFVPAVIIKDGPNGSFYQDANDTIHQEGIGVKVIDTTGAGDNFNCGFLYGQLRGYSIGQSLRIGNICGGLSVSDYGGAISSPTEKELLSDWLF